MNGKFSGKTPLVKTLRLSGPGLGTTGYEHMTRCFIRALAAQGVKLELHCLLSWSSTRLPPESLADFKKLNHRRVQTRFHLHFCLPQQVKPSAGCRNINYTMFEATRLSQLWTEHSLKRDLIIVPTESSRRCWLNSGMPEHKVKVCPLGVDFSQFNPQVKPMAVPVSNGKPFDQFRFRFLNVSDFGGRKNIGGLLRAWLAATDKTDDAVFILKTNLNTPQKREKFQNHLHNAEEQAGKRFADAAPFMLLEKSLLPEEMPNLFAAATHYWSVSHGEGFDLPMFEAAATGLQLVAPDHSAYQDYLRPEFAHLIPAREVPAHIDDTPQLLSFFAGANWWQPDETAVVETLRGLIRGSISSKPSARPALMPKYTWENAAKRLQEILAEGPQ
ncbi:MAG TPA: hypothetical protein VFV23_10220 [Verrucomicrobiae bacterium]|nr:hypothetical protein [Verrucomicrobiae bacterium]